MESNIVTKVKNVKKLISLLSVVLSSSVLTTLAIFGTFALIALLVFLPFMVFADSDQLQAGSGDVPTWNAPQQLDADGTLFAWPVPSITRISSTFGLRDIGEGGEYHNGIDIANGPANTELQPIYAMAAGTVTQAGPASGYGQAIYIDHGGGLVTKYGHLSAAMEVQVGQVVAKGQLIGRIGVGIVGRSTGPHLHFQVELNGTAVDPLQYVQAPGAAVPIQLSYEALDIPKVMAFLAERNSALADNAIITMIDQAGRLKNVSPYLLLAITGQEQSFVPRSNNHASEIIRNPWNVFGCWCSGKGSTLTTGEAATIAANTIIKLSQDLPAGRDPIQWLVARDNPRGYYASDTGWWIGVSKFYKALRGG
ncbi:M23 family metallopeptidase [Paenibacillus graminis]|uniref:M23 family metallopeptidase n=1 Tax=Paenibacillus graminis TaxID=189425 RepID=UPI002DB7C4DC|nr:M23 family metallopeptidase [Paenibacillus graminis]MEC0167380.1 M23 family metallopeptidase [Paenibacillus graminis]